ncbi:MAG: hypothetical protein KDE06_07290 [Rhodobacteraceae bacterium]|nr:hypothetical protein [Paracoccaceae bacterium]MCC0046961.1 hypothetical protein [Defluviimonas sp.]MCB2133103.1 hypothetical protein [Paracoccaceae bacterium]MCB2139795.1 hypothetical protein [Paracoccaceae bacterium]MCB2141971.1 hypothetical protein [Paracoccaceae bacterium]
MAVAALAVLAACGPMSVERAEDACFERARLAAGPRGMIAAGAGSGGAKAKIKLELSSDYVLGRDPSALYDACVYQKSGQPPRQPLYTRRDWKG